MAQKHATYIDLTSEMVKALSAESRRTGLGAIAAFKSFDDPPKGLKPGQIQHWLSGRVKTLRKDHFEYVLSSWKALPDYEEKPGSGLYRPWHHLISSDEAG